MVMRLMEALCQPDNREHRHLLCSDGLQCPRCCIGWTVKFSCPRPDNREQRRLLCSTCICGLADTEGPKFLTWRIAIHTSRKLRTRVVINLDPGISGNEKNWDPSWRGHALVDFKHREKGQRFRHS
ncbi:RNA recognition motif (RRM)-containing protein-like protein [Striga asiatica]|uniref:RNA recognition motif (RRM)-containing protein-like protein n=1 Tax=Striga asiatica TaxID=4170 RepID=A0A5A7R6G6_STRAF|nr:RNA recognition motif (RRM)-containing protein-like protein [Striga asiatica]